MYAKTESLKIPYNVNEEDIIADKYDYPCENLNM